MKLSTVKHKTLTLIDQQLEHVQTALVNVTDVRERVSLLTELSGVLKILHAITDGGEDGQEEAPTKTEKTLTEIFGEK